LGSSRTFDLGQGFGSLADGIEGWIGEQAKAIDLDHWGRAADQGDAP
jgi:hypothetical protein